MPVFPSTVCGVESFWRQREQVDASPLDKLLLLSGYIRRLNDRHQGFTKQQWVAAAHGKTRQKVFIRLNSLVLIPTTMKFLQFLFCSYSKHGHISFYPNKRQQNKQISWCPRISTSVLIHHRQDYIYNCNCITLQLMIIDWTVTKASTSC